MISSTASACVRSILPCMKARKVNSPLRAGLKPSWTSLADSLLRTMREPCVEISTASSPV